MSVFPGLGLGLRGAGGGLGGGWPDVRHARPERRLHLGPAGRAAAGHRCAHGPHPGQRRPAEHAFRQGLRRRPGGNATLPFQLAAPLRVTGADGGGRPPPPSRCPPWTTGSPPGTGSGSCSTTTDFAYATPAAPATYLVALAGPGLSVPTDPALTVQSGALPWWVWAAPIAALAAAAFILIARRRAGGRDRRRTWPGFRWRSPA